MTAILSPAIKNYDWGDFTALPDFIGAPRDAKPWAELWFGTHPDGQATLQTGQGKVALKDVVGELSFLVKLIGVAKPLSIQTHPTSAQALAGFERENSLGIDRTAFNRVYRDKTSKPELLCALSDFEMLCGFAPVTESLARAEQNGWLELARHLKLTGIEKTVRWALEEKAHKTLSNLPQHLHKVAELYPNSGGLLVALLMNYVVLKPGDAVYLDPGNVHSYLGGVAVEVMSSSDNVMRAAFTQKHIDLNEFFATASFESRNALMVSPSSPTGDEVNYQIDSAPFTVQRITVNDYTSLTAQSEIELYLCVQGQSGVLRQGQACVLRKHETLKLSGPSVVFRIHEK